MPGGTENSQAKDHAARHATVPVCYPQSSSVQSHCSASDRLLEGFGGSPCSKILDIVACQGLALQVRHLIGDFRCGALPWAKSRNEVAYSCLPREPLLLPRA